MLGMKECMMKLVNQEDDVRVVGRGDESGTERQG